MRPSHTALLVLVIALAVGGLAFIQSSLSKPPKAEIEKKAELDRAVRPLSFATLIADNQKPHTRFWRNVYELGESGHFDYWFENPNPELVRLGIKSTSCTCQGAEITSIEPKAWADFLGTANLSSPPFVAPPNLLTVVAMVNLEKTFDWHEVKIKDDALGNTIPAAEPAGPRMGILRVSWKGQKVEELRSLKAEVLAQLPGSVAVATPLAAVIMVRSPLEIFVPGNASEVNFGDLRAGQTVRREFVVWSATRRDLDLGLSWIGEESPCLTFDKPVRVSSEELDALFGPKDSGESQAALCAYRVVVHVAESVPNPEKPDKPFRLDLGLIERALRVQVSDEPEKGGKRVPVRGIIRGEISVRMEKIGGTGGTLNGRLDFGPPFDPRTAHTIRAELIAEAPGIDVEEVADAHRPGFLQVKLTPNEVRAGAPPTWRLEVTIPADSLGGDLPSDAHIVVRTKGENPRRFRIPVSAQASGGVSSRTKF